MHLQKKNYKSSTKYTGYESLAMYYNLEVKFFLHFLKILILNIF